MYFAFLYLQKAYDRADRKALLQVVSVYGVGGKLSRALQSVYENNRICVKVGGEESKWFESNVGQR